MSTSFRSLVCVWCVASAVGLAAPQSAVAQSKSWNADQLANPFPAPATEQSLIEALRSGEPAEKAFACKQLAIYGSEDAVPELAKLLSDEQLASWSRIALEAIPGPAADAALLEAAKSLQGNLLVGTINSIGVRRYDGAVEHLSTRLNDADASVASAAAVALGRIGNAPATAALRKSLKNLPVGAEAAVAEGCILCAERLLQEGKLDEAAEIYDEVRQADVPKTRILEATRGAILARESGGVPLLVETLRSSDYDLFEIGLSTARELRGRGVGDALAAELSRATPARASLMLVALADRRETPIAPAVFEAAKQGDTLVRLAAIRLIGRLGDASSVATLLAIAADENPEIAQTAKEALAELPGSDVDAQIASRLSSAEGRALPTLIEIVGQRRIDATQALVDALNQDDDATRLAALAALGETVKLGDLGVLIAQVENPQHEGDLAAAEQALKAACIRMPERDECARQLADALPRMSTATKEKLLEVLGAMGGPSALKTIAAAAKSDDVELQDTSTRLLGQWMTTDAAPVLLDLATDPSNKKFQVRALRGYIRLARQFSKSDAQRAEMCRQALEAAQRIDEQKMVLQVLELYPSEETLEVAKQAAKSPTLKDEAERVSLAIAEKLGNKK